MPKKRPKEVFVDFWDARSTVMLCVTLFNSQPKLQPFWSRPPLPQTKIYVINVGVIGGGDNFAVQGPVIQSFISLTSLLRGQLVKCFTTL